MIDTYRHIGRSQTIAGRPAVIFNQPKQGFYHAYEHIPLQTDNFQAEIKAYLSRKQSFSGHVLTVHKIKDEKITYNLGDPSMEITVLTEFVPWRLHLQEASLTLEEALFLLEGACKGFRELLHRMRVPFLIQVHMIGIEGNGKVKVWWNQFFYKSKLKFPIVEPIKLKTMVKSLIMSVQSRMNPESVNQLQTIVRDCENFQALQQRIKYNSKGLSLEFFGKKLIKNMPEQMALSELREESHVSGQKSELSINLSKMSSMKDLASLRRMTSLTTDHESPIEFSRKAGIRKRTLGVNNTIIADEKLKLIKDDIENLRMSPNSIDKNVSGISNKLRSAKSVGSLHSYDLGISGNKNIPIVNKMIKESKMLENEKDRISISRFIQPRINEKINPENCHVCTDLSEVRHSQLKIDLKQKSHLYSSGLKNGFLQDKEVNSTARSFFESKNEKSNGAQTERCKFGQSGKKQAESVYFTSLFDI